MSHANLDAQFKKTYSRNSVDKDYKLDPYSDKEIELQFLNSKPSCFLFMGKPGAGSSTLAKLFVDEFQCEYINGKELIEQHLENQTEFGKKVQTILEDGGIINEELVIDLIKHKIESPEVAHRGYLLDGFPNTSFTDIDFIEQFNILKSFKMQPDYIIYLKIPDVDLKDRLQSQRMDPETGDIYFKQNYDPDFPPAIEVPPQIVVKKEKTGEEEEEEEEEEAEDEELLEEGEIGAKSNPDFPLLDAETIKKLMKRPEDFPDKIEVKISNYTNKAANMINDYIDNFNSLNVINLNANLPPQTVFKQLIERLRYFIIHPAAVPIELYHVAGEDEEEETPDGSDIDELFRELSSKNCPVPGFRWLKSEWFNYCPVALHEGILQPGKPQFAVGFLNKVYILSTKERMNLFVRNPRPYLLPSQPEIPCKISVIGPKGSGKSSLSHLLANVYNAKVIDMQMIMKPHEEQAKKEYLEKVFAKSTKDSIDAVHAKIKQQMELEKTESMAKTAVEKLGETAIDSLEENTRDRIVNEEYEEEEQFEKPDLRSEDTIQGQTSFEEEIVKDLPEKLPEFIVDESNPEVQDLVKKAMEDAEKHKIELPADVYLEELEKNIKEVEEEQQIRQPNGKIHGGWILDNFPNKRDQWTGLIESAPEKFLLPDQIIVLKDGSENFQFLLKRWYASNKENIDSIIAARVGDKIKDSGTAKPDQEVVMSTDAELPPPGPEINSARKEISDWYQDWTGVSSIISGAPSHIEVIETNIDDKTADTLLQSTQKELEKIFKPVATEVTGTDLEEDEEDEGAAAEENEEEQAEEEEEQETEEEPNRSKKKLLGDTNYWCPVALKTHKVLCPGNPEIAAKYLGKMYYFFDEDSRDLFMQNPLEYIPVHQIPQSPPLRLIILGAKGSGKTTHGRKIAQKLGLFHISFQEILQEYILPKNLKKIGPEFKEGDPVPDFIMPDPALEEIEKVSDTDIKTESSGEKQITEDAGLENEEQPNKIKDEIKDEEMEEWDENENAIRENLENQQSLSTDLLESLLKDFWNKQPFESKGFILEGFPRNAEEAQFLNEKKFFVNGVISLLTTEDDIIARLLPPRLEKWKNRRSQKDLYKRKLAEYKAKKKQMKMDKRRKEILANLEEKRNKKYNKEKVIKNESDEENEEEEEEAEEEDEDLEEEVNIDDMLAEEFEEEEEPEEEEEEDTEELAREQIENEIREIYDGDTNEISSVMESFAEMQIPRFEIEAGAKPTIVQYRLFKKLKKILDRRESIFERCYPISPKIAEKLIKYGHKYLSRFGRWCPVSLLNEKGSFFPLVDETHPTFPVIYRNYIYFTKSKEAKDLFMTNPLKYIKQPSPKDAVPIKICILGLPKVGKTTLAERFVKQYGLMRITGGSALRKVLNENWNTDLAREIKNYLIKGLIVPHELVIKSIELLLMDSQSTTKGYVLDGYPLAIDQIKLMNDRGIIPSRVFELIASPRELILRANKDRSTIELPFPMHDSSKIIAIKMANYSNNINDIRQWYGEEHDNIRSIDGEKGTWFIWEKAKSDVKEQIYHIQNYLFDRREGKAANIYNLCIRPSEFQARLSNLKEYCPVSLARTQELVHLNQDSDMHFAAEYKGYYYKMKGLEELDYFYDYAEEILKIASLPEHLPNKIDPYKIHDMFPMQLDLQGYCPVCFLDGKCRYEGLILGNKEKYIVEYRSKLYTFCCDACLSKFMRSPSKYWGLELPKKLPPVKSSLNIKNLPLPGYLEQTMADALRNALTATGTLKPKYPFIDPSRSALLYIALHLKAYNPKSPEHLRRKYKHKLEEFENSCELIKYLSNHMTLKYKEVEHRPVGFDKKMAEFLNLKKLEDNEDRWIN